MAALQLRPHQEPQWPPDFSKEVVRYGAVALASGMTGIGSSAGMLSMIAAARGPRLADHE